MVQSGCVEEHLRNITHSLQLIRLGSEQVESFEEHRQLPSVTCSSFTASNFKNEPDLRLRDRFTMPARGNLKKPKKSYYRTRVSNGSSDGNTEQVPASPPVITVTAEVHIDSSQALPSLSPSPSPSSTESPSPPPPTPPPRVVVTSEEREPCEFTNRAVVYIFLKLIEGLIGGWGSGFEFVGRFIVKFGSWRFNLVLRTQLS